MLVVIAGEGTLLIYEGQSQRGAPLVNHFRHWRVIPCLDRNGVIISDQRVWIVEVARDVRGLGGSPDVICISVSNNDFSDQMIGITT